MAEREGAERVFLIGAILVLGYLTYLVFSPFLQWVILGFLFAYLFYKPYLGALQVLRRKGLAAGFLLATLLGLFFLPFIVVIVFLARDVAGTAELIGTTDFNLVLRSMLQDLAMLFGVPTTEEALNSAANTIGSSIRDNANEFFNRFAASLITVVANVLVGLIIFGFTVFYGLVDGPRFLAGIRSVIPLHRREKDLLLTELRNIVNAVFVGHVLVASIQAAIGTLGFLALGVPSTFLWGFVMLLAAFIPLVGPVAVWVPVGLYLLLSDGTVNGWFSTDRTFAAFGVLLVVGPLVSTIDNIIRPKLVGSRADVHPFLVLVGAVGGLFTFGFTGFVVGPLVLALFLAVLRVYREHWKEDDHGEPKRAAPRKPRAARARAPARA